MNASQPPPPIPDYNNLLAPEDIGGFRYGIGVSLGVLLLITTITLASYYCTRNQLISSSSSQTNQDSTLFHHHHHHHVIIDVVPGLDEETIQSFPKIRYSEAKDSEMASTCCPICLGDYKGNHLLRHLPDCNHLFHIKCIDTWLRLNPTCPVCRTSPLPTPLSTPLVEVVPLASSVASTRMS